MPRANPLRPSFNAGEFSEWMVARTDFQKYPNALETCLNLIPLPQGGLTRRPGTRFVAAAKDSSALTRLKRFEFSTTQAYVCEFGNRYVRFYRNQGQIIVPGSSAVISNGTFASDLTDWDDRSDGAASIAHDSTDEDMNLVGAAGGVAWAEQDVGFGASALGVEHVVKFRVRGVAGDTIQLRIGDASKAAGSVSDVEYTTGFHCVAFTPATSPSYIQFRNTNAKTISIDDVSLIAQGAAVEIDSPYPTADLFAVEGPQSADTLYLFHPSYAPHKLVRGGHTSWSLIEVAWADGPWLAQNTDTSKTLTPSATSGLGITITAVGHAPFAATDVGRLVRIDNPSSGVDWGWARITAFTSPTVVTVDVDATDTFGDTTADANWRLGAWSDTTGWPRCGAFFEQRLVAAGTTNQPQTMWFSQSGDSENHKPDDGAGTVADDDALDYTISADDVNAILWMSPGQELVVGTAGGEWIPTHSTGSASLTPTDIDVKRHTKHGSATVQPVRIGHVALFLQKAGRKIREFAFHFEVDGNRAFDMTRLASHVLRGGITEMDFQQEPWGQLWCVRADGQAAALTYLRDEDVIGWGRHVIGGSFGAGDAVVESIAVIPGNTVTNSSDRDEGWMIVKRTINGETKRYVEFLEGDWETGDSQADAFYVDSGLTYDGSPVTEITGLDHLEGETLGVWADGAIQPDVVVAGGKVTLDSAASKAQIGYRYRHTLKSLKLEAGAAAGTAVGKTSRIHDLTAVVLNSHTMGVGPDLDNLQQIDFREVSDAMDAAVPLFSGEKQVGGFEGDYLPDPRIVISSDDPAPFTLLALAPELKTNDGP